MKLRIFLGACLMFLSLGNNLIAQNPKIGYANIDAVLAMMPETKSMQQELQTYEQKLVEELQTRRQYLQTLYGEYQEMVAPFQNGASQPTADQQTQIEEKQQEVLKVEEALKERQEQAQQKVMNKRQEKMAPIIERIQDQIDVIAAEEDYDYIFNAVDGSGVSIILHAPESDNLTMQLLKKLDIEIPEGMDANLELESASEPDNN